MKKLPIVKCPYCGSEAELKDNKVIYGKSYGRSWICKNYPECDAYVGCHKKTGIPLGRLADAELREWKSEAHHIFDELWKNAHPKGRYEARKRAYKKMQEIMSMTPEQAHIGNFDVYQCKMLITKLTGIDCTHPF